MTDQKNLKRRVRARMEKTGERYTAARRHVVADPEPEPAEPDLSGLASGDAVAAATGRGWSEWYEFANATSDLAQLVAQGINGAPSFSEAAYRQALARLELAAAALPPERQPE